MVSLYLIIVESKTKHRVEVAANPPKNRTLGELRPNRGDCVLIILPAEDCRPVQRPRSSESLLEGALRRVDIALRACRVRHVIGIPDDEDPGR